MVVLVWMNLSLPGAADPAVTYDGISEARHDLEMGFEINGVVAEVLVEEGQQVKAGDTLVRLDARDAKASAELLRLRAESTFEIESARAEWELAQVEQERAEEAMARGAGSDLEVRRARLQTERERLAFELFKQRQQEAVLQWERARVDLDRYVIRAPRDGVVEGLEVEKGEFVREVTPVLRLVDISSLRIEVPVPHAVADRLASGDEAIVVHEPTPASARVVRVATVGDPASGTRVVVVDMDNPNARAAGEMVRVRFASID
jgi:RND family efflux transporter MFP subunit